MSSLAYSRTMSLASASISLHDSVDFYHRRIFVSRLIFGKVHTAFLQINALYPRPVSNSPYTILPVAGFNTLYALGFPQLMSTLGTLEQQLSLDHHDVVFIVSTQQFGQYTCDKIVRNVLQ